MDLEARRRFAVALCDEIFVLMASTPIDVPFGPMLRSLNERALEQFYG